MPFTERFWAAFTASSRHFVHILQSGASELDINCWVGVAATSLTLSLRCYHATVYQVGTVVWLTGP